MRAKNAAASFTGRNPRALPGSVNRGTRIRYKSRKGEKKAAGVPLGRAFARMVTRTRRIPPAQRRALQTEFVARAFCAPATWRLYRECKQHQAAHRGGSIGEWMDIGALEMAAAFANRDPSQWRNRLNALAAQAAAAQKDVRWVGLKKTAGLNSEATNVVRECLTTVMGYLDALKTAAKTL